MDFVVVGFGLGALVVLLGLGIRILGPRQWPIQAEYPLGAAGLANAVLRGRICRASGATVACGGVIILVATVAAVAGQAGDQTGDLVVLAAGLTALGGVALWAIAAYNQRRLDPLLQRFGQWSEWRWASAKRSRDQVRSQRRVSAQRRRQAAANRPRPVPRASRKAPVREAPKPDAERGWLPPLPLDVDDDWPSSAEASNGASDGRIDDVPSRRVAGR